MEYHRGDAVIPNTSLKLLTVSASITSFDFGVSYFPYAELPIDPAIGPLSHAGTLEGRTLQAVSIEHRGRHERP